MLANLNKINIVYLVPSLKGAAGGVKVIYSHSTILNSLNKNLTSSVLHLKKKKIYKIKLSIQKRIKFLEDKKYGWDGKQMIPDKNFLPSNIWANEKLNIKKDINFNKNEDFIIIPEIWAHFADDLDFVKKKIKYSIFVQGFYHMKSNSSFKKIKKAYENAKLIITDSEYSIDYLKQMFPKCKNKIYRVNLSVDSKKFEKIKKKNLITFMPRKLPGHSELLQFYLKNLLPKNWKIEPLKNMTEKKLYEKMCSSKIFLSFSNLEGIGMPPIEAALSRNVVIGYIGGGGSEYWRKPIFNKIEYGEIKKFGDKVLNTIKNHSTNWISQTNQQRENLKKKYSKKNEIKSVKILANKITKFFN